jgi:hypothetical protein
VEDRLLGDHDLIVEQVALGTGVQASIENSKREGEGAGPAPAR